MAALQRLALRGTPKATKQAARYTPAGGAERCGMCRHYVPSSSCARIEGPVSAAGWCQLFSRQVTYPHHAGVQSFGAGGASLDLDFMNGALPPGITFTRASTGTYFDATGAMRTATANTPRWDYDPVAHSLNGLLIEEARTNSIPNSMMTGAAAGTPGTNPTGWVVGGSAVLTRSVVGTGVDNGITYIDYRYTGTPTAGGNLTFFFVPTGVAGGVSSSVGQLWSQSVYVSTPTGVVPAGTSIQSRCNQYDSGGTTLTTITGSAVGSVTPGSVATFRLTNTYTLNAATVAFVQPFILFGIAPNASAVDFTIRIGAPQMELGATNTSYIPTTAAAVTRAAEVCSMPTAAWFNASASSLAAEFMVAQSPNLSATLVRDACALSDGTAANRLMLRAQIVSAATAALATSIAGTATASGSLGVTTANVAAKIAASWSGTTGNGSLNGGAAVSYAVGMPAGLTTLAIGNDYSGASAYLNGWVRRVRYWSRALSAAELQSVTI